MDLIPPMRFYEVLVSDALAIVMPLQTRHVCRCVLPRREYEFGVGKPQIEFLVKKEPGPVFKRFVLLGFRENFLDLISFDFKSEVHIVSLVLEAETPEAIPERGCSRFWQADADHFSFSYRSQVQPAAANPIIDSGRNHASPVTTSE